MKGNRSHEDKIANLLKNMQERKDRKRISLEDRLKRMEELTKKQTKAALSKKKNASEQKENLKKTKILSEIEEDNSLRIENPKAKMS